MRFSGGSIVELLIAAVVGIVMPYLAWQELSGSLSDRIGFTVLLVFLLSLAYGLIRDALRGGQWITAREDE